MIRSLLSSFLIAVVLTGCKAKAPATAMETCKELLAYAELDKTVCTQSPPTSFKNFAPNVKDAACFGPIPDDCKGFVLLYESTAAHQAAEKMEADSAVRVAQSVGAAVVVRIVDPEFSPVALQRLQKRLDGWER